jgi:hypothetical protein
VCERLDQNSDGEEPALVPLIVSVSCCAAIRTGAGLAPSIGSTKMTDDSALNWLGQIQSQVKAGQSPTVSVRELLKRFNAQRRGIHVVSKVRSDLAAYDLTTLPDFEGEYIDNLVRFDVATRKENIALDHDKHGSPEALHDPTFRIGKLPAANKTPVSVKPNDRVSSAITIMLFIQRIRCSNQ